MSVRVLGLDPGTATFGWGVVESDGERLVHRGHGVILTDASHALGDRLPVDRVIDGTSHTYVGEWLEFFIHRDIFNFW